MPSAHGQEKGTLTSDFAATILFHDVWDGSRELEAKRSETLSWNLNAISENLESNGRR